MESVTCFYKMAFSFRCLPAFSVVFCLLEIMIGMTGYLCFLWQIIRCD